MRGRAHKLKNSAASDCLAMMLLAKCKVGCCNIYHFVTGRACRTVKSASDTNWNLMGAGTVAVRCYCLHLALFYPC